jgi:hypothetical protein
MLKNFFIAGTLFYFVALISCFITLFKVTSTEFDLDKVKKSRDVLFRNIIILIILGFIPILHWLEGLSFLILAVEISKRG